MAELWKADFTNWERENDYYHCQNMIGNNLNTAYCQNCVLILPRVM